MQLSWKQLVVVGGVATIAAATSLIVYRRYSSSSAGQKQQQQQQQQQQRQKERSKHSDESKAQASASLPKKKKRSAPAPADTSSSNGKDKTSANRNSTSHAPEMDGAPPIEMNAIAEVMEKCDLPLNELLSCSVEEKQRIFYALLTKGEYILNQGAIPQALDYFTKAVSIVPNPGEVVAAFEKTLPPPLFNALLDKIQVAIATKVGDYFRSLPPNDGIVFQELDAPQETLPEMPAGMPFPPNARKVWRPHKAKRSANLGDCLWEEGAEIAAPLSTNDFSAFQNSCEWCLKTLLPSSSSSSMENDENIKCPACNEVRYCSPECKERAGPVLHPFFCRPDAVAQEALEELIALGRENNSSLSLLMVRYLAMLLGEELRGNGAGVHGPFIHYDHLFPVFLAPTSLDKQEVKLMRRFFGASNKEMVEFLSEDIYASMKHTLARHVYRVGPDTVDESDETTTLTANSHSHDKVINLSRQETRNVVTGEGEGLALAFYPVAAHLAHSCDPNVYIVYQHATASIKSNGKNKVKVMALRPIKAGEQLTISFLPFGEGTSASTRRLHLQRIFGFTCRCNACENDLCTAA